jgi:hypothetical protein
MGYLGNTPTTQSFTSGTDYFNGTGSQTAFTLTRSVNSVNDIQVTVNNVVQQPNDAYTVSGTTLTMTSAPSSGTNNVYVRYLSTTTQTIAPSSGLALSAALGTASSPSYSFAGDSNTGIFSPASDTIAFAEGGVESMRITSAGNVTIGNTDTGWSADSHLALGKSSTSGAGYTAYSSTTGYGGLYFADGATGTDRYRGYMEYQHNGDYLVLATSATERMRIDSSGNLLIACTNTNESSSVGIRAEATGAFSVTRVESTNAASTLDVYSTGAGLYRFYVNMAGTVFATSTTITGISDQRLKENIVDLDDGLSAVMALKPRKFDWKAGKGKDIKGDRGFIAQEFETVFPDMIDTWKDPAPEGEEPYKAVNANLIPTLVKAIQELNTDLANTKLLLTEVSNKVEAQAAEIAALKGANNAS